MPYGKPDQTDPMTLSGVVLEDVGAPTQEAVLEMAECFIDEYARLGFDANRILHVFRTKGYAGPYMATELLGEQTIRELVEMVLARWGGRRTGGIVQQTQKDQWSLTVLDS
jgi:hypothetical protein